MNSLDSSSKLYSPKPIRAMPKSVPYNNRLLTIPTPCRVSPIPFRGENYTLESLTRTQASDDKLAMMAEVERELLKRTISFSERPNKQIYEGRAMSRSYPNLDELERPSNAMTHDDFFEEENY